MILKRDNTALFTSYYKTIQRTKSYLDIKQVETKSVWW